MSLNSSEIETIIRVVIERLRTLEPARHPTQPIESLAAKRPNTGRPADSATLRLHEKLITLTAVRNRLTGIQVLEVSDRAIVTPAVIDELRERGVRLARQTNVEPNNNSAPQFLLFAPHTKHSHNQIAVQQVESPELEVTAQEISSHVIAKNHAAIWCSPRPFAAVMATRPHPAMRAVQLASFQDLPLVMAQVDANVLILDDRHWSAASLANLTRTWKVSR